MVRGSEWIKSLPNGFQESVGEIGCVVKWTPQKEVLAHAAVGGIQPLRVFNLEREYRKRLMVDMEGNGIRKRAMNLKEKATLCLMEGGSTSCSVNGLTKHTSLV
ncbi:hypothetical protein Golob_024051 [Gossypium lobatum]|uniref:Uncharacterized protein n=1 Tax=Gossypium lobatum TaxID=34289 RepID=A0A7J8NIJ1_9ROSI|nr:hypothetical protein [Gossypium lobatum]